MKHISTHIDDDVADRFAAAAKAHGGKSAFLRRLVTMVVDGDANAAVPALPAAEGRAVHLSIRLSENEVQAVRKSAKARGMKPGQWLRSIVRVSMGSGPQHAPAELHDIRALINQVRKIGVNLNQLTRAANEARLEGISFVVDRDVLERAQKEVAVALQGMHAIAKGNLRSLGASVDE